MLGRMRRMFAVPFIAALLGGGVVANRRLRERMQQAADEAGLTVLYPSLPLCTDNAAMIACAGYHRLARGELTSFEIGADPGLPLDRALPERRPA